MLLLVRGELVLKQVEEPRTGVESESGDVDPSSGEINGIVRAAYVIGGTQQIVAIVEVAEYVQVVPLLLAAFPTARHVELAEATRVVEHPIPATVREGTTS